MPNPYIENAERWKVLSAIDYFTQFVKAWITFNAWYKNFYPQLETDREIIEEIKKGNNNFKNKLLSLLDGQNNECEQIKVYISDLHYQLERKYIYSKDNERITFTKIVIGINSVTEEEFMSRRIRYKCTRDPDNWKEINVSVLNRRDVSLLSLRQTNGYSLEELESNEEYKELGLAAQGLIKSCYEGINPRKPIELTTNASNSLRLGQSHFINDTDQVSKGIIAVLYLLRNALFHGRIVPDTETQKVYEPAYHILRLLIEHL